MKNLEFKEWIVKESEICDAIKSGVANGFIAYAELKKKMLAVGEEVPKERKVRKEKKSSARKHSDKDIKKWLLEFAK